MSRTVHVLIAVVSCALLGLLACRKSLQDDGSAPDATTPVASHAIHSDQLQKLMRGLGEEVRVSWPQEIAEERAASDRRAQFREAARIGRLLANSAPNIKAAISDVQLGDAERKIFTDNVVLLEGQARDLAAVAAREDAEAMGASLRDIKATCTACHGQFAELAGPIRFGPADR